MSAPTEYEDDLLGNPVYQVSPSTEEELDEVEIEIVDDRPEEDRVPPRNPEAKDKEYDLESEIEGVDDKVNKRIKKLTYEYNEERRSKEAAIRERDEAFRYAQSMKDMVDRGEEVLVKEVKARTAAESKQAEDELKAAYEDGDPEEVTKRFKTLADASYRSMMAESYNPGAAERVEAPQPAAQPQPDPKAQAWKERNSWYGEDKDKTDFANAVHARLTTSGVDPTSDTYYEEIDKALGRVFSTEEESEPSGEMRAEERVAAPQRVVSPGNRTGGEAKNTVRLTSSQVALAKRLGVPLKLYAKQMQLMENTGE